MTKHLILEDGYAGAFQRALDTGGQLHAGKSRNGCSVVVCGSNVSTHWEPNSSVRARTIEAARLFDYDPTIATPGRIARHIIDKTIGIPKDKNAWHPRFKKLAKNGFHWHYQHVKTGYHPYLFEFDVRSAYAASILNAPSLRYDYDAGYLPDEGNLESLKALLGIVPKWLRVTLFGTLSSHQMQFATIKQGADGNPAVRYHRIDKIDYGSTFNATHKGILRLYRTMERLHNILGEHCARMHTDSFAIAPTIPVDIEKKAFAWLAENGLEVALKAHGSAHFWDLNTGLIGKKLIGSRFDIGECIERDGQKVKLRSVTEETLQRFQARDCEANPDNIKVADPAVARGLHQLEIGLELPAQYLERWHG